MDSVGECAIHEYFSRTLEARLDLIQRGMESVQESIGKLATVSAELAMSIDEQRKIHAEIDDVRDACVSIRQAMTGEMIEKERAYATAMIERQKIQHDLVNAVGVISQQGETIDKMIQATTELKNAQLKATARADMAMKIAVVLPTTIAFGGWLLAKLLHLNF